jgi:anaerobic magnesium-protoporphyrin IX monomethyl ester cyclase
VKVHFIYPDVSTYFYPGAHHGLASIASVLKFGGHRVSLYHVKKEPSRKEVIDTIRRESPDLIAFSAVTNQINYVAELSAWIKQEFPIPTVCGGIHATLYPEEVIGFPGIDICCRGEGEYPLLELAESPGRTDIKNLWFKRGSDIIKNPLRPLISSLDDLPHPDYTIFDCATILADRRGDFAVMASRGCPFQCTYCCNHALKKVCEGNGKYFRLRSVDSVLKELGLLTQQYPIKHFSFADDIFGMVRDWSLEFCRKYPQQFELSFECNLRAEMVDEELLRALKAAHCTDISMGVEAGNERLRTKVLRRKMTNKQIIRAFDLARKYGIRTMAYNMIGLPYETPEMIRETINLNRRLAPDRIAIFFFYPYPGTELYETCKREGFLSDKQTTSYVSASVLNLPTVTPEELEKLYTEFYGYAIERRIQSFPALLRPPLKTTSAFLIRVLGRRAIEVLMNVYLRLFSLFSLLEGRVKTEKF